MRISIPYKHILITGGAGFIGSNFIHYLLEDNEYEGVVINCDCLTYAGNLRNLESISERFEGTQYFFEKADITDMIALSRIFDIYPIDCVVHFAAESHVDRSIHSPARFLETNINGTFNLLECCRMQESKRHTKVRLHHISTDEVYGSLDTEGKFTELTPYNPRSPYSATKAASDHLVRSYYYTYNLPVTVSNCSNNYGPYQFPEKLIPFMILRILQRNSLPVYGDGSNIRDWIHVRDHCYGIALILQQGVIGETYNIGSANEYTNLEIIDLLCSFLSTHLQVSKDELTSLIEFVPDRLGHDKRYAIDYTKIHRTLKYKPQVNFYSGLQDTVDWYIKHLDWVESINSGSYKEWIASNYTNRR